MTEAPNPFDQFDGSAAAAPISTAPAAAAANPFDQFDKAPAVAPAPAGAQSAAPGHIDNPLEDASLAPGMGAQARASLPPDLNVEAKRLQEIYPDRDFEVVGNRIREKLPDGRYAWTDPKVFKQHGIGNTLQAAGDFVASGTGQAIPTAIGTAGAIAGAKSRVPGAATALATAGGAAGEVIRQTMDKALAPDATPMDWANVGWQALQQAGGPLIGKVAEPVVKGVGKAGAWAADKAGAAARAIPGVAAASDWTADKAAALAGKLGEAIKNVPGLQALASNGQPIVATMAPDAESGQNLIGLTKEARDAVMHYLSGKFDDIKAGMAAAKQWGIDLSLGQATEDPVLMQAERQQARFPWGAEGFSARRKLQNEQQIPGAMGKFMDEFSPWQPEEGGQAVDAFREGAVAAKEKAWSDRAQLAAPAFKAALDDRTDRFWTPEIDNLMKRPSVQAGLANAKKIAAEEGYDRLTVPEYQNGKLVGNATVPDWRSWQYIKQGIDQVIDENTNEAGKLNTYGSKVYATKQKLMGILTKANPEWGQALQEYGSSSDKVNMILRGGVKRLADMDQPDRLNMVTSLFSGGQGSPLPNEISQMRQAFIDADRLPEWNAGLRAHLQNALDTAMTPTQGGDASNVGGKLYKGLWGNQRQENVIRAALGNDDQLMGRWNSLGDALKRAAHQLPEGSPTITDANATGVPGMIRSGLKAVAAMTHPAGAAARSLADYIEKIQTPEMRRKIVDYMLTTDGDRQLAALQSTLNTTNLPKGTKQLLLQPRAQVLLGSFLSNAAAHGTAAATETPDPGYAKGGALKHRVSIPKPPQLSRLQPWAP